MDDELFQILSLFLLLGLLLTLFGVLQSLGAIRKALEKGDTGSAGTTPAAAAPVATPAVETSAPAGSAGDADQSPLTWGRPTDAEAGAERSGWPSPQEATAAPTPDPEPEPIRQQREPSRETQPEPSRETQPEPERESRPEPAQETPATRDTGARVLYGDTGLTTATPSEAALRTSTPDESTANPFETTPEPRRQEPEAQRPAEDPQEQPFERDGRWWFRRGDELLVYEEQTGQWVAAGEPSTTGSVSASSGAGGGASSSSEDGGAGAGGQVTTQLEQAASFWKCPSCGAVNGSTATSCRMCFTARP